MNKKDIVNGLKDVLDGAIFGVGVSWPNLDYSGSRPFLEVSFPTVVRTGATLKGNQVVREIGRMMVIVVADLNEGEDTANDFADQVEALFVEGKTIAITGGNVVITAPPEIRGGFRDGPDWRVPVLIRYTATST